MKGLPLIFANLLCSLFQFQCDLGKSVAKIHFTESDVKSILGPLIMTPGQRRARINERIKDFIDEHGECDTQTELVHTKAGAIQGFTMEMNETREILAFTGVPFGEPTGGDRRFRDPVPKKPWRGIWKATSPSPVCNQFLKGTEDCLYLDVYTLSTTGAKLLPVIVWIPGGGFIFGSSRSYGPLYFLKEDVVFVVPNFRLGIFGHLTTGDAASPGNWSLKDISLAIQWVHDNIEKFGGDPERIYVGGISSGAQTAQSMMFTNHKIKSYIKGIIAMSGTVLINVGLDATGRVKRASDLIAKIVGCPTSAEGKSEEIVECLRGKNSYVLGIVQYFIYTRLPLFSQMFGPILEPDVPGAYLTVLPEVQYEKGTVPKIPMIISRTEDESSMALTQLRYPYVVMTGARWDEWMPEFLRVGYRSFNGEPPKSSEETALSLEKITRLYFNRTYSPQLWRRKHFVAMVKLVDDTLINAAMWKSIKFHHKIAPTYAYINRQNTFTVFNPLTKVIEHVALSDFSSGHATEFAILFSGSYHPRLEPGTDYAIISENLINFIANFATHGEPFYRNSEGELLSLWKPVNDMSEPRVLDVGLLHNITMRRDPLAGTRRLEIWDTVRF